MRVLLYKRRDSELDLGKEIKYAVDEKFEFEDREKSKFLASFGFFGLSNIQPT